MCFTIHVDHPKSKVATTPIKCYKVVTKPITHGGPYSAEMQYFFYTPGKLYKTPFTKGIIDKRNIYRGFHSFTSRYAANEWRGSGNEVIKEFVIPKGARYYYNPVSKQYVSNRIKMVKSSKS